MGKPVQENFGEAIIGAVRDFAQSDLEDVQTLEAKMFSHIGDAGLRQVIAETLYGARWVYKLGLALLVRDVEQMAHVRQQVVDYGAVCEGLLSDMIHHAIATDRMRGRKYKYADTKNLRDTINWNVKDKIKPIKRRSFHWLIEVAEEERIILPAVAKKLHHMRRERNTVGRLQKPGRGGPDLLYCGVQRGRIGMGRPAGFFDVEERLAGLSKKGDDLERLQTVIDFELFRPELERAVPRADRSKGGRPPFDHVLMFKVLILQTQNNLSDERTEFYLRDRLTWMRFLGLGLGDPVPDANTIWTFREALTKAGAIEGLFELFDRELRSAGYLAMSGQLVDATIVAAPKQRNTRAEKQAIKDGRVPEDWQDKPAKLAQKDRDARWTVKTTKAKSREGETPMVDLAIPEFGYQNHISADRRHRLIRRWLVTDAAAHAGARLADLLDAGNTASDVWADTGYRSRKNEALLRQRMLVSHIHRKKPTRRPMPPRIARANAKKSAIRAHIEHVFAEQKAKMGLFVRTIGLARATTKIGLANLVYNMRRLLWLDRQPTLN